MKAVFVPVRSPQWNCEESADDGGIEFPTHECNEDLSSLNRQMPRIISEKGKTWHHIANTAFYKLSNVDFNTHVYV